MTELASRVVYRDNDHTYWLDGRRLPSVTELLRKHGIAPSLGAVPQELLNAKAERGTYVHSEIETFLETGEYGVSDEFQDFLQLVLPMAKNWSAEVMVATEQYAGRCDLIGMTEDGFIIVDTKTGSVDMNSVAWQCSMYANAMPEQVRKNCKCYVFDAKMNGESRVVELEKISEQAIDELLKADTLGEIYNPLAELMTTLETEIVESEREIAETELRLKTLKENRDAYWLSVLESMKQWGVKTFDGPSLHLCYVAPTTRQSVDSAKLKKNHPDIYAECLKTSTVKESLRVKVKTEA